MGKSKRSRGSDQAAEAWATVVVYRPTEPEATNLQYIQWLRARGATVVVFTTGTKLSTYLDTHNVTALLIDFDQGPEAVDAVEVENFQHRAPGLRVVALVPPEMRDSETLGHLVRSRLIYDFQTFPLDRERFLFAIGHIRGMAAIEARETPQETPAGEDDEPFMVGSHPAMLRVYTAIRKVAKANTPVLITGESGTGKELVAQAIHERSPFRKGPFVAINCAGLPASLIGSELFGHEKGAFTDAKERKLGKIEVASNGTLLLDEIGDLPLDLQGHLLRFLQERTIERIGGTQTIKVTTRVIAATNIDLAEAVEEGRFRRDLYYRLNVLPVHMPPLRERGNDVELLAKFFLRKFSRELDRPELQLRPSALEAIRHYPWPGNVRELISVMRRAVVMAESRTIDAVSLQLPVDIETDGTLDSLETARARAEREVIEQALHKHRDNVQRAARELGVSRVTLYRLMEKHSVLPLTRGRKDQRGWVSGSDLVQ